MSRDGEPQDPWLENFNARRAAMDKKFDAMDKKHADSYQKLVNHGLAMDKQSASINAKLTAKMEELNATMEQFMSSFDNVKRQCHRSRSHSSRSSSRSNHGSHHERHRQPYPQEAQEQPHGWSGKPSRLAPSKPTTPS
jgi:hypothetical protein